MKLVFKLPLSIAASAALFTTIAMAQDWYVGGQASWMSQSDSANSGQFTQDHTLGMSGGTLGNTTQTAGTNVRWKSGFDSGYGLSGEVGKRLNNGLRGGFELAFSEAGVDDHRGVTIGGTPADNEDYALLTGSALATGNTVGATLQNGQGHIKNTAAFANVYYDFNRGGAVEPYVGAGIGVSRVEVDYSTATGQLGKDSSNEFAYQVKAGATYRINDRWEAYGEYTYRATDDVSVDMSIVPVKLEVENEQQLLGVGLRYRFGY